MLADAAHYREGLCTASGLTADDALGLHREGTGFVWLSLVDPSGDELRALETTFGLHAVAGADILSRHERPKFEVYADDICFVVLRTAHYGPGGRVDFGELAVFLGPDFAVTSRKGGVHAQASARTMLDRRPDLIEQGAPAVLWAILARVVDDMRVVVDALEDDVDRLEADVFSDTDDDHTRWIFDLRQQVAQLYRAVHPMLAPLDAIERGAWGRLLEVRPHLREIGDRARVLHEDIVGQRDRLTAVLEADIALLGHRQNQSVRKISGWAAILAVPTLIAGVFGMNFQVLPGASLAVGFPLCVISMLVAAGAVHLALRRAGWM